MSFNTDIMTLGSHSFEEIYETIVLPEGEDTNEWVATNLSDLFNQVTMLYGTLSEYCTDRSCPIMSAGAVREYCWTDPSTGQATSCSAPKYVDMLVDEFIIKKSYFIYFPFRLFTWMQNLLEDESLFPSKPESSFSPDFTDTAKSMLKRLFRVFAHVYHCHTDNLFGLGQLRHVRI